MKKKLFQTVEIPEGIEVSLDENKLKIKGPEGELVREFKIPNLEFKVEGKEIIIGNDRATKMEKKKMNTIVAHINNMIKGVQEKFEYVLKICYHHFPITLDVKGNEITIKNFLGEKVPRKSKIIPGSEVKIEKEIITVTSINKELAGQTAANLETATKIRNKDRRVFQDGIFMLSKAGKDI